MANRRSACLALVAALMMLVWSAPQVLAQAKADATGTWKWEQAGGRGGGRGGGGGRRGGGGGAPGGGGPATQPGAAGGPGAGGARRGGGQPREYTATLKQEGDKLTGKVVGANFQDPTAADDIKEGSVKADGTVTFQLVRDFNGNSITTTYTGKLDGDTIKGTFAVEFPGGAPGGGAPGGGAAAPGGGAPGGGGAANGGGRRGGAGGGGRGGFGGPQEWTATRSK